MTVLPTGDVEYTGQPVHEPPAGPMYPALQTQLVMIVLPAGDVLYCGQY